MILIEIILFAMIIKQGGSTKSKSELGLPAKCVEILGYFGNKSFALIYLLSTRKISSNLLRGMSEAAKNTRTLNF